MDNIPKPAKRLPSRATLEKREAALKAKLEQLAEEEKRLRAHRAIITSRENAAIRKSDTRRKILLGGELIAAAKAGDRTAIDLIRHFIAKQDKPHNRKAFEGWRL